MIAVLVLVAVRRGG